MIAEALYNKYRPQSFDDVVGQGHIIPILQQASKENALVHAYLLVGPRGTGKTTTARLIAKELSVSGMDLVEIDAASNTGVDAMRDIIEKAQFAPTVSKAKVYIIDEVHMLSKSAFNALLKTLEEPPEHVYFVLATTEVHKVPITIISRCQRFDFHRVAIDDIVCRLAYISKQEQMQASEEALRLIAQNADGGMRDAINILQQVERDGVIDIDRVISLLGLAERTFIKEFLQLLMKKNQKVIALTEQFYQQGANIEQFAKAVLAYIKDELFKYQEDNNEMKQLIAIAQLFVEKDFRTARNPLFELQLMLYQYMGDDIVISSIETSVTKSSTHIEKKEPTTSETVNQSSPVETEQQKSENLKKVKEDKENTFTSPVSSPKDTSTDYNFDIQAIYKGVLQHLESPQLRLSFKMTEIVSFHQDTLTLSVPSQFQLDKLNTAESKNVLETLFSQQAGKSIQIVFQLRSPQSQKPSNENILDDVNSLFGS